MSPLVPRIGPRPAAALLLAHAALTLGACSPTRVSESAPALDAALLPGALAVRSDTPYVTGAIVQRDGEGARLRVRVRAREGAAVSDGRVPEAVVSVSPDSLLLWRDGRPASPAELVVGRRVVVWVRGPELRSLPPQVTGSAILIESR